MSSISVRNVRFNYETEGNGFPLLLIHGLGGDLRNWAQQMREFSKRYRVFAIDLRGHGSSDAPNAPYSIDVFTKDIVEFMKIVGLPKAYVAGLSMGGMIAQNLAARHPELVEALILTDTSSKPGKMTDAGLDVAGKVMENSAKVAEAQGRGPLADITLKLMFSAGFLERDPKTAAQVREYIVNGPVKGYVGAIRNIFLTPLDLTPLLPEIKAPTLIICGRNDALTPLAESEKMKSLIPGAKLEIIDDCGHVSIIEKHAEYNAILGAFLKKMDARRYVTPKAVRYY